MKITKVEPLHVGQFMFCRIETDDGVRIHAFWLPAPGATRAILFFHGNAGNASHRLPNAAELMQKRWPVGAGPSSKTWPR